MRRGLSLLVLAYASVGNAADVVTVYRNPGPDGKCGCSTVANVLATSLPSSPAPGTGASVAGNSGAAAAAAGAGSKAPTYSYDGTVVDGLGETTSFSSGFSSVSSTQALTYPFSAANSYNPAAEAARAAAQTGTQPIGFQVAVSSVFVNVIIQGATGTYRTEIGAGGLGIDYTNANKYFAQTGPLISPGATVFVTTSVTRTVSGIVATATTTVAGANGVDSGARSTSSGSSIGTNANGQSSNSASISGTTSIAAQPTTMTTSVSGVMVVPVDSSSSSAGQPAPASNLYILRDSNGNPFACENGTLKVQPVGSTGDVVSINPNTTLTCGATEAYVEQANTASQMKRRNIAGRAVMNSTDYFAIRLAPFGQAPAFSTVFGFSVSSSELQLVVNGTSLDFALSSGILLAYDPATGAPPGVATLEIGASSTSPTTSTMPTATSVLPTTSDSATETAGSEQSASSQATASISMSVSASQATTSASDSVSSTLSGSSTTSGTTTGSSQSSSFSSSETSTSASDSSSSSTSGTSTSSSSSTASASSTVVPEVTTNGCALDVSTEKRVFAHMIMGNNFAYTQSDFYNDFTTAASYGIDGMALNVGAQAWQLDRTALAYAAAEALSETGVCFKVFVSYDMTSLTKDLAPDGSYLTPYVDNFKSHPAQFYYDNRHFVSTYGGYQQIDWIGTFINPLLDNGIDAYFVPAYSIQTYAAAAYATEESSGQFLWNTWPNNAATGAPTDTYISPALSQEYISNKGNKTFMANVSPWFFTHFDNSVKNFVFKSEGLWQQRWSQLASTLRAGTDFVQITSWNDWGESHYIGPVGPQNPNTLYPVDSFGYDSQSWLRVTNDPYPSGADDGLNGYLDHGAFGDQARAWISAYKTGAPIAVTPAALPVSQNALDLYYEDPDSDRAYVSYRLQYNDAVTSEATSREPTGSDFAEDVIVLDAYISGTQNATANVVFSIYDGTNSNGASEAYSLPPGVSQTFIPFRNLKQGGDGARRCGGVSISIATMHGYTIDFDDLKPIMTAAVAAQSNINFNAFTKKTVGYTAVV